jgi:hypothetical protein
MPVVFASININRATTRGFNTAPILSTLPWLNRSALFSVVLLHTHIDSFVAFVGILGVVVERRRNGGDWRARRQCA